MLNINDISAEVMQQVTSAEKLETVHASGIVSGFHAHCNEESAEASGVRLGKTLARETYTSSQVREARSSGQGPTAVLKAALLRAGATL